MRGQRQEEILLADLASIKAGAEQFWALVIALAALGVSSVGGAVALVGVTCQEAAARGCFPPAAWLPVPLIPFAITAMFVQQAALQNARATYERALERVIRRSRPPVIRPDMSGPIPVPSFAEIASRMFDPRRVLRRPLLLWVSVFPYAVVLMVDIAVIVIMGQQLPGTGYWRCGGVAGYVLLLGMFARTLVTALSPGLLGRLARTKRFD